MKSVYPTFITKSDSMYLVYVPDMDIYTEGTDFADAIEMARDAIGLKGIDMEDEGMELPIPSDAEGALKKAKADADEVFDFTQGTLTFVDIDFTVYRKRMNNKMVRRNVTLPYYLNYEADRAHINVSRVLQEALQEKLLVK